MRIVYAGLLAAVALAQTPAEKKPAIIEGKVLNSVSGEAIRKAELTLTTSLMPDGMDGMVAGMGAVFGLGDDTPIPEMPKSKEPKKTFTATSDATGKFRIENVDPGEYYFKVKHTGFVEQTYKPTGANASEGMLHISSGQELHDIEFRLVPQGALSGKV